jgi:acetyl esterase/lipase
VPLHPTAAAILPLFKEVGLDLGPDATPERARARMAAATGLMPVRPVHAVEDRAIPGRDGDVPVRIYWPNANTNLPVVMWIHGGGWVLGSLETHDNACRMLCDDVGAVVVSVDYRLAPETKFPGAVDDCVAAWQWVSTYAEELRGDADRIAIAGDSAGDNLAAVTCLVARD